MKVINRVTGTNMANDNTYVTYTFDTGHEFRQWSSGAYYAYTPKGNYTSQATALKLMRLASEFEDRRVQVEA